VNLNGGEKPRGGEKRQFHLGEQKIFVETLHRSFKPGIPAVSQYLDQEKKPRQGKKKR